jgi:uncharacterized protein (TIGR00266 family)
MKADQIDYKIFGEEMQYVDIELDPQETAIGESGSFLMMDVGVQMATLFGDGSGQETSFFGKLMSAGKRLVTGESLFITAFTNHSNIKQRVAFAAPYPGKIIPLDLQRFNGKVICQKDAFLCAAKGVSIGIEFQRKLGTGLFGGEGFIMQKLEGDGFAFMHAGGHVFERQLFPGELIRIDTGCIVGYTQEVDFDIEFIGGIKNVIFGGEGLFYATLRGPGTVWIQTLPVSRLASRILSYGRTGKEEGGGSGVFGSVLGGLTSMTGGDRD